MLSRLRMALNRKSNGFINRFSVLQYQILKLPSNLYGDAIASYVKSDKDKKLFDTKFLDDLKNDQKDTVLLSRRIWLGNLSLIIILVLSYHGLAPETTLFGIKLLRVERYGEIIIFLSASLSMLNIFFGIKQIVLQDSIEKILEVIIPLKLYPAYYLKYSSSPQIAASLAQITLRKRKDVLLNSSILDFILYLGMSVIILVPVLYGSLFIIFSVAVHVEILFRLWLHPNLTSWLSKTIMLYAVLTDTLSVIVILSLYIPRRYRDLEIVKITEKYPKNSTQWQNLMGSHLEKRKSKFRANLKVP